MSFYMLKQKQIYFDFSFSTLVLVMGFFQFLKVVEKKSPSKTFWLKPRFIIDSCKLTDSQKALKFRYRFFSSEGLDYMVYSYEQSRRVEVCGKFLPSVSFQQAVFNNLFRSLFLTTVVSKIINASFSLFEMKFDCRMDQEISYEVAQQYHSKEKIYH